MLERTVSNDVMWLRIDRPEVKNAVSAALLTDLSARLATLDPERHDACVITGVGDSFSAGGDIQAMAERDERPLESYERLQDSLNAVIETMTTAPVPIIAKVNGDAIGAGANLAFAADFVIASRDARFGEPFVNIGLIPDGGGTVFLPQLVGLRRAKELTMTGRLFEADEAVETGLINRAVPPAELDDAVSELLETLTAKPTAILGLTKRAIHENLGRPFRDGLDREATYQTFAYGSEAHERGVARFLDRRDDQ